MTLSFSLILTLSVVFCKPLRALFGLDGHLNGSKPFFFSCQKESAGDAATLQFSSTNGWVSLKAFQENDGNTNSLDNPGIFASNLMLKVYNVELVWLHLYCLFLDFQEGNGIALSPKGILLLFLPFTFEKQENLKQPFPKGMGVKKITSLMIWLTENKLCSQNLFTI